MEAQRTSQEDEGAEYQGPRSRPPRNRTPECGNQRTHTDANCVAAHVSAKRSDAGFVVGIDAIYRTTRTERVGEFREDNNLKPEFLARGIARLEAISAEFDYNLAQQYVQQAREFLNRVQSLNSGSP